MRVPFSSPALVLAAALGALTGCGGQVAGNAPALLSLDEIAARAEVVDDTTRGARAASELAWRGARLRERAAMIRRSGLPSAERVSLLRRADELKSR
jgi:hypothetical protein